MIFMLDLKSIREQKYLALETYRKNNLPVQTPVWFVIYKDLIHVVTREDTGKIRRLRNNNNVRIALCTFNGKTTGKWFPATAQFVSPADTKVVLNLRRKKHGFMERIARFVSRKKGEFVVFSIKVNEN